MNYMRYVKLMVLSMVVFASCSSNNSSEQDQGGANTINLSGTVSYPQDGAIVLERYEGGKLVPHDTITLNDDYTFSKDVKVEQPNYFRLNFYGRQMVTLILDEDDVKVRVDGNSPSGYSEIEGSRDHDFIDEVKALYSGSGSPDTVKQMQMQFMEAQNEGDAQRAQQIVEGMKAYVAELLKAKIDSMGASLAVVEILKSGNYIDKDSNYEFFQEYAEVLEEEMPDSEIAQSFINDVENMKKLAIGQIAPDIALPNPDGEVVKLSSLRGNYVLVDFWAYWCKPCRMENPNVVRVYNKYHDKGFEVYGVSLDRKREDWLKAIEQDGLKWTQVSDLKYWNSEAARLYNVNSIPFALLLDPEGRIIGKNLRGLALEKKLADIFSDGVIK